MPKKPTLKGSGASSASSTKKQGSTSAASASAAVAATAARSAGSSGAAPSGGSGSSKKDNDCMIPPPAAGYLISCDVPLKQFIQYLNELKPVDKRFILGQDLDATHLLIKSTAKEEIMKKVEEWEDSNIFSAVERVGEDFDLA